MKLEYWAIPRLLLSTHYLILSAACFLVGDLGCFRTLRQQPGVVTSDFSDTGA